MNLDDFDRRVVREAREDLAEGSWPRGRASLGVPAAVLGVLVLLGWPRVVDAVPGGAFVSPFVVLAGVLLLIGGPIFALTSGGSGRRAAEAAVEAAARRLEDPEADRETILRAAALLLRHAYWSRGATTVPTFDLETVAERIAGNLPTVVAVERELISDEVIDPVFTRAEDD